MAARSNEVGITRSAKKGTAAEPRRPAQAAPSPASAVAAPERSRQWSVDPSPFSRPAPAYTASREQRIALEAYYRAERRGFAPGGELEDWLAAERAIDDGAP
jgi:hypothetical protein